MPQELLTFFFLGIASSFTLGFVLGKVYGRKKANEKIIHELNRINPQNER